ncbi:MAG: SCP2 sterol-binding domain-containing protein, partial [Betaproteobacteria bacterium]
MMEPLSGLARRAANATWRDVDWARDRLRAHSGMVVRFEIWPLGFAAVTLRISADGDWEDAAPGPTPDATVRLTPAVLARLASSSGKLGTALAPDAIGDPALVEALREIHDVLPLAIEERLAAAIGPLAAHGIASATRSIAAWPAYAAERAGAGLAAYWTQESATLPGRPAFESLRQDLATLSQRVDALGT